MIFMQVLLSRPATRALGLCSMDAKPERKNKGRPKAAFD